jgi:hypothetical protein
MSKIVRPRPIVSLTAVCLALPLLLGSCEQAQKAAGGENPLAAVCCTDFKVGADLTAVDWGISDAALSGKFSAFAQAGSDLSAVASGALSDITTACRNIATDLGASPDDPSLITGTQKKTGVEAMNAWCALAKGQITARFGASGTLAASVAVTYDPPQCTASFDAKASCQGHCDASAKCDLKATPPKCTGGQLSVECSGSCTASGSAALHCTGSCSGNCQGSCTPSTGTVNCVGQCDGDCSARAANGSCSGTCSGKCTMDSTAAPVTCNGVCEGTCDATCQATGTIKARCDGTCDADISAPKCEGGKLEGGCTASADCEASCNASAQAKAECTPPAIRVTATANASLTAAQQVELKAALASLEANLPNVILVIKARGQAFVDGITAVGTAGATLTASADSLGVKGVACGLAITAVVAQASTNFTASLSAAVSIGTSVGVS